MQSEAILCFFYALIIIQSSHFVGLHCSFKETWFVVYNWELLHKAFIICTYLFIAFRHVYRLFNDQCSLNNVIGPTNDLFLETAYVYDAIDWNRHHIRLQYPMVVLVRDWKLAVRFLLIAGGHFTFKKMLQTRQDYLYIFFFLNKEKKK